MWSVVDRSVVMRRMTIECVQILSLLPNKSSVFFLTLHEISAVPLRFPKKGRSDIICFDLPFFTVPYFTSSSAHMHFLESCEHRSQVGNTGLWLVNVCLRCRPEDWLLWTGDSRSFTQSPKGNPGKAPHINP